jgi:Major intrinsic protein
MTVQPSLPHAPVGEVLGTYLLVLFGTGSVAAAVLTNAQLGLWQIAVVWGFGVTIAIYTSAALSGRISTPQCLWPWLSGDGTTSRLPSAPVHGGATSGSYPGGRPTRLVIPAVFTAV